MHGYNNEITIARLVLSIKFSNNIYYIPRYFIQCRVYPPLNNNWIETRY